MTSIAEISSRIRRDPRSAHMAEPPAPAMSRAVATGACSRTTASTIAAPSWDWAPICWSSEPTSRAMTMPKGIETRISGSVVTRARNQHWSKNSATGRPRQEELAQRLEPDGEHVPGLLEETEQPVEGPALGELRPGPGRRRADRASRATLPVSPERMAPDAHAASPRPLGEMCVIILSAVPTA